RAAAERLDLPLEPLDLERFLGPYERVPVQAQRRVALAEAMVGVAQMLDDGRILARQLDRSLELLDGSLVLAALVVHPAQAVDVDAVVRLQLEGAADQALGLVELHAHVGEGVSEIVERGGVARIELDGLPHLRHRALLVVRLVVGGAEREPVAIVVRRAGDDLLQQRDGAGILLLLAVARRQVCHPLAGCPARGRRSAPAAGWRGDPASPGGRATPGMPSARGCPAAAPVPPPARGWR